MRNRSSLVALAAAAMSTGLASSFASAVELRPSAARGGNVFLPSGSAPRSSPNGGRRGRGMAAKRAAVKARNVKRHRAHCKA